MQAKKAGIHLPGDKLAGIAEGGISNISSKAFGLVMTRLETNVSSQEGEK